MRASVLAYFVIRWSRDLYRKILHLAMAVDIGFSIFMCQYSYNAPGSIQNLGRMGWAVGAPSNVRIRSIYAPCHPWCPILEPRSVWDSWAFSVKAYSSHNVGVYPRGVKWIWKNPYSLKRQFAGLNSWSIQKNSFWNVIVGQETRPVKHCFVQWLLSHWQLFRLTK